MLFIAFSVMACGDGGGSSGDTGYTYTVTFDSGDDVITEANPVAKTVTKPATAIDAMPADPVKNDCIFDGWYTAENGGGDKFTPETEVTEDITLYAKWIAATLKLEYTLINGDAEYSVKCSDETISGAVYIPAYHGGKPVTAIANVGFAGCVNITGFLLPETITVIGTQAFYSCTNLVNINIPSGVTSIGYQSFYECSNLVSISLPAGIDMIAYALFYECTKLESITIPANVSYMRLYAFYNCTSLKTVNMLPATAPGIEPDGTDGTNPFTGVTGCTLHLRSANTGYDVAPWTTTEIFSTVTSDL